MKPGKEKKNKQKLSINWPAIHVLLTEYQNKLNQDWTPGSDEVKKILKSRAKILAQEPKSLNDYEEYVEVIKFKLSEEIYALELSFLQGVYPLNNLTSLPCTPAHVVGVINFHGRIITVIDIKKFLAIPELGLTDKNRVIILYSKFMEIGILADQVFEVSNINFTLLQKSLPSIKGMHKKYLKGITPEGIAILDAANLLSNTSMVVDEQV